MDVRAAVRKRCYNKYHNNRMITVTVTDQITAMITAMITITITVTVTTTITVTTSFSHQHFLVSSSPSGARPTEPGFCSAPKDRFSILLTTNSAHMNTFNLS